jgi:hypothetical protein
MKTTVRTLIIAHKAGEIRAVDAFTKEDLEKHISKVSYVFNKMKNTSDKFIFATENSEEETVGSFDNLKDWKVFFKKYFL